MAKSKKSISSGLSTIADRALNNMSYRDLQRACIARGMDFDELLNSSVLQLHSWFNNNYDRSQNLTLLDDFDNHVEAELNRIGSENPNKKDYLDPNHPLKHASLKLGFIGKLDEEGNVIERKKPRLKGLEKKKRIKKERIEGTKVIKGTKKGLTYKLTLKGRSLERIIAKVQERFGEDVNVNSISIWHKRALKEMKEKK